MNTSDSISFGGLIVTMITSLVFPFIQVPLLDYSFEPDYIFKQDPKDLTIKIHNSGLAPAKHVIGALKADNLTFSKITSEPFLSNYFRTNTNTSGTTGYRANTTTGYKTNTTPSENGFFDIDVLPPGSETSITTKMDISKSNNDTQMTVYLRSDEGVGHVNYIVSITLGAYVAFLIGAPLVFVYIYRQS